MVCSGEQKTRKSRFPRLPIYRISKKAFQIGANANNPVPAQAAKVGFIQPTFNTNFSSSTVDITNTQKPGFNWYPWNFFNTSTDLSAIVLNGDGSVTLNGDTTGPNGELATISWTGTPGSFVGSAFGGGGYFEATLKFNPQDVIDKNFVGWPSFWLMAREHFTNDPQQQWPGQGANYDHLIEADILEYNLYPFTGLRNSYTAGVHDWSGVYASAGCPNNFSSPVVRTVDPATDFTQFHKYGMLWVPATARTRGSIKFYFDDAQIGSSITWSQYTNQDPGSYSEFGIIDKQHLVLVLGTGVGIPMTVRSVNVWQSKPR